MSPIRTSRNLGDGLDRGREGFAERRLVQCKSLRDAVHLVRTHDHVARERTVHPVAHPAPVPTEHEPAGAAVGTLAAGDRGGAQDGDRITGSHAGDMVARLDHPARELVPQNHRRVVAKRVAQDVKVGPADAAECDLDLDLVLAAAGFFDIPDLDVPVPGRVLYECLHKPSS